MRFPQALDFSTQTLDRGYLETVRDGFRGVGASPEVLWYIIYVLAGAVAILAVGYVVNLTRQKFRWRQMPEGWIIGKKNVVEVLDKALLERSKFEMRFLPAHKARKSTFCTLENITNDTLTLELPSGLNVTSKWIEREVEFYFKVTVKHQMIFYRFYSEIAGAKRKPGDVSVVMVSIPKVLELQQKRAFLRVEPPTQYVLGCALWREMSAQTAKSTVNVKKWGKPNLVYIPGQSLNPLVIENLSAGGIRITIKREAQKAGYTELIVGQRFFLLLELYDPDLQEKKRFWALARLQNYFVDFSTKNVDMGMQFMLWGRPRQEEPHMVEWLQVSDEGIEPLAGWIMKRHLELYRDKGLS